MRLCEAAAMDGAIMLGADRRPGDVPPCDEPADVGIETRGSGTFWLCSGCAQALDVFMTIGRRVIDAQKGTT